LRSYPGQASVSATEADSARVYPWFRVVVGEAGLVGCGEVTVVCLVAVLVASFWVAGAESALAWSKVEAVPLTRGRCTAVLSGLGREVGVGWPRS